MLIKTNLINCFFVVKDYFAPPLGVDSNLCLCPCHVSCTCVLKTPNFNFFPLFFKISPLLIIRCMQVVYFIIRFMTLTDKSPMTKSLLPPYFRTFSNKQTNQNFHSEFRISTSQHHRTLTYQRISLNNKPSGYR